MPVQPYGRPGTLEEWIEDVGTVARTLHRRGSLARDEDIQLVNLPQRRDRRRIDADPLGIAGVRSPFRLDATDAADHGATGHDARRPDGS